MSYYAQINNDKVIYSVSELAGSVERSDMIQIDSYDQSLLGKKYNAETGEFEELPPE